MNYIAASSVENKDNEITLRNDNPKSIYDLKGEGSLGESSLRNDVPLADHSLRRELNAPVSAPLDSHKRFLDAGKVKWSKTHFIVGIESGSSMKRKWGQTLSGIQNWLRSISSDNVLVSLFTYDTSARVAAVYRKPTDMNSIIDKGVEANGGNTVDLAVALSTFPEIVNAEEGRDKISPDWLHYCVIFACQDSPYPQNAVDELVKFKETNGNLFFSALTQVDRTFEMTKIATALEGVHHSIRKNADYGKSFVEALTRDPTKFY